MSRAVLRLDNVCVAYDRQLAVQGITGAFEPGSLTAIAGPNGAGKSTLLKAVMGSLSLTAGTISRDDLDIESGRRSNYFSRLELTVRPFSSLHVLELTAKGTVRNKEIFNRSQFQLLAEADINVFAELVDHWVLEFAELYAARARE